MNMNNTVLKINIFKRLLPCLLFILPMLIHVNAAAQGEIPTALIEAFKSGNSIELAKFFNSSIELAFPGQEEIYSKQQAELIVKDFFAKHVPTNFVILHKGGKEVQYAIGNLKTASQNYRVTLQIKIRENKPYIHQLRFEEENAQ
jgi:hypothetical protein